MKNSAQLMWFSISYWFIDNLQITANLWAVYADQFQQQSRWNQCFGQLRNANLCSQTSRLQAALSFLFKLWPFSNVSLQFPVFCLIQLMVDSLFIDVSGEAASSPQQSREFEFSELHNASLTLLGAISPSRKKKFKYCNAPVAFNGWKITLPWVRR